MNDSFQINECDLSFLTTVSGDWQHSCFDIQIGQNSSNLITVFCCQAANYSDMEANWCEINGTIAADYIAYLENSFERWNVYLLFTCIEAIPQALQYEIENNKFALRKMVKSDTGKMLNNIELITILNQKILATKIEINNVSLSSNEPPIFSETTTRLLAAKLNTENVKTFSFGRKQWLDAELEGMIVDED